MSPSQAREPYAVVERVTKRYVTRAGGVDALDAVSATVPLGSTTALVGVSGSGKSTLLRLLAGLEVPTSGRIAVGGAEPARLAPAALRRLRREQVAFVSQRAADNLFPHLSLAEHVPGAGRACFEQLGVAHRLDGRPSELSGGELARAAFAVALARATPFVVIDEPTAELDGASAELVLGAIAEAARRGTTFVVATHDPDVLGIADHVVELARGRNAAAGTTPTAPADPAGTDWALRADGLTKSYGGVRTLERVSLAVHASELAVVHGRSGSGKSTLLMLLGGWLEPDAGSVEVGRGWGELAYVPQRFGLVPELTVSENVELPARLAGLRVHDEALLESLALDGLAARYPTEISIGQQQRVAIARALRLRPAVLLVDEPTSHQDAGSAELVWAALTAAAAAGTACLVATHEPDARARAHVSWELEAGSLLSG